MGSDCFADKPDGISLPRHRLPDALRKTGVAVEYFPSYEHAKRKQEHGHDFLEINFLVSGRSEHWLGGEAYEESPGAVGITHYGIQHEIITPDGPVEIINLYADPQRHPLPPVPPSLTTWLGELIPLHANLGHRHNQIRHLQFDRKEPVEGLLRAMMREQEEEAIGYEAALFSYFGLFLMACCRCLAEEGRLVVRHLEGEELRLEELRQHLEERYREPVVLDVLASRLGMSRSHLCRRFKHYTGKTLTQYVIERRIREAMLLLRTTSEKVIHIAHECGFADVSFFNRKFRKLTQTTPRDYRATLLGAG